MNNEIMRKGRFQQKCDTTENWNKAGQHGFVPKKGEIIIYQDFNGNVPLTPKFKSGDGITNINNLPFSAVGIEQGQGENSIQQTGTRAQALSIASVAFGKDTATLNFKAGVTNINRASELTYEVTNTTITFSSPTITDLAISEICFKYSTAGSKYFHYVREQISALPFIYNIPEEDSGSIIENTISVDYLIAITSAKDNTGLAAVSAGFGNTAAGLGATALGYNTRALHNSTFSAGYGNESAADGASTVGALNLNKSAAGFVSGKNNSALAGYDHFIAGNNNTIEGGAHNAAIGQDNIIKSGTQCGFIFGKSNQVSGNYPQAGGVGCKAHGTQRVFGKYNVLDETGTYVDIVGWGESSTTPKNIYTLDTAGNAKFAGSLTAGGAVFSGDVTATVNGKSISLSALNTTIGNLDSTYLKKVGNAKRTILLCGLGFNNADDKIEYSLIWGYDGKTNGETQHYIKESNFSLLGGANNKITKSSSSAVLGEGNTLSSSNRSLVVGYLNTVESDSSRSLVAGSGNTVRNASWSLVAGASHNVQDAPYSLVAGQGNKARASWQAIVGCYNEIDTDALFIVGNGESASKPGNAFVVKKDGNVLVQQKVNGYTNKTEVTSEGVLISYQEGLYKTTLGSHGLTINAGSTPATITLIGYHDTQPSTTSISSGDTTIGRNLTVNGTLTIGKTTINEALLKQLLESANIKGLMGEYGEASF